MAKATKPHVEDIPHEEIKVTRRTQKGTAAVAIIEKSAEDRAKEEIQKLNLADARIAQLKQEFTGLTIEKDGLEKVKQARGIVRTLRTGLEKKRKDINADYIVITKGVNGEAKRLTALLEEIEEPLDAEIKAEEQRKEQEKREKEEREQAALNQRINDLLNAGMKFNGNYYAIGETVAIDVVMIKTLSNDEFNRLMETVKGVNAEIEAEAARVQAEKEAEEQRLQQQKEEQEKERQRLENERAEMERQKKELHEQVYKMRVGLLETMGFKTGNGFMYFENEAGKQYVDGLTLDTVDADFWKEQLEKTIAAVKFLNKEAVRVKEERAKKEEQNNQRRAVLFGLGLQYANGFFIVLGDGVNLYSYSEAKLMGYDEKEFSEAVNHITKQIAGVKAELEQQAKEVAEREEKQRVEAENARLAAMGDAEKIKNFLAAVLTAQTTAVPTVTQNSELFKYLNDYLKVVRDAADTLFIQIERVETK